MWVQVEVELQVFQLQVKKIVSSINRLLLIGCENESLVSNYELDWRARAWNKRSKLRRVANWFEFKKRKKS